MPELLFYQRPTRLSRITHAKVRFTPLANYKFAAKVTSVPLIGAEFPLVSRQYPIIFTENAEGQVSAQAVLSLTKDVNSFVDEKGMWTATYVPAFIRRYPFVLAEIPGKAEDFDVAFDDASECFSSKEKDKGDALFDDHGGPTPFLQSQIEFLQRFHAEHRATQEFLKTIKKDNLLMPYNVDIVRGADKARFAVRNTMVVDEAKVVGLSAEQAASYLKRGYLALLYAHLISLQSFLAVANRTGSPASDAAPWWAK